MSKSSKTQDRPVGFIKHPAARPKIDSRIKKKSTVIWRHREYPLRSDGTTAGDRSGWITTYIATVLIREKLRPTVKVIKHVSAPAEHGFEYNIGTETTGFIDEMELAE